MMVVLIIFCAASAALLVWVGLDMELHDLREHPNHGPAVPLHRHSK
jgi:hypothetical protein